MVKNKHDLNNQMRRAVRKETDRVASAFCWSVYPGVCGCALSSVLQVKKKYFLIERVEENISMYSRTGLYCGFLSLKRNSTRTGQGPLYLDMVPDDRLAHNSIMEDCFMVRLRVWTSTDTHRRFPDPRKTPFVLWNSMCNGCMPVRAVCKPHSPDLKKRRSSDWH